VLGALVAGILLPGRGASEVELGAEASADAVLDRYPEYVPYVSA
jgi:hypothetical protein